MFMFIFYGHLLAREVSTLFTIVKRNSIDCSKCNFIKGKQLIKHTPLFTKNVMVT